jgi:uncharacterized protein (TIGR03437 family)
LPASLVDGAAELFIKASDGSIAAGLINISRVRPSLFSQNSDGSGVIAANIVRIETNGLQRYESLSQFDPLSNRMITKPIDLGPVGERVFLEIYMTGIRQAQDENNDGNLNEHITVLMGGKTLTPSYAGKQGFFAGIDQINVEVPRDFTGKGKINLSIYSTVSPTRYSSSGFTSNVVELEIASSTGPASPNFSSININNVNVGDIVSITGSGFSSNLLENVVTFGGVKGDVEAASANQLTVRIPYGARSGKVVVKTPLGEATTRFGYINILTSISGIIETLDPFLELVPLTNFSVRIAGTTISTKTDQTGKFTLVNPPTGLITFEIDSSTAGGNFAPATLSTIVEASRNNLLSSTILLNKQGLAPITDPNDINTVIGVITDTDGITPVPNALLRLTQSNQTTVTDSSGAFVFRNVASETVSVEVIRANGTILQLSQPMDRFSFGNSTISILNLSLKNANIKRSAPYILIPPTPASINAGQRYSLTIAASDTLGSQQNVKLSADNLPAGSTFILTNSATGVFEWTPNESGVFSITFTADLNGITTSQSVIITVVPSITIVAPLSQTIEAGNVLSFTVSASAIGAMPLELKLSTGEVPSGATFKLSNNSTGVFEWTPTNSQIGRYAVTFSANFNGIVTSQTTTITVNPSISINAPASQSIKAGEILSFTVSAIATSSKQSSIQLRASNVPTGAAFELINNFTGVFKWTPTDNQAGNFMVTFQAELNGAIVSQSVEITVSTPAPPTIILSQYEILTVEGKEISVKVSTADGLGSPQDLKLIAKDLPAGATFSVANNTGTFSWTPTSGQFGSYTISFTATNSLTKQSSTATVKISVLKRPPPTPSGWQVDVNSRTNFNTFANNIKRVFGGSYNGVYISYNSRPEQFAGGPSFQGSPLSGKPIRALATTKDILVALVEGEGVYRSQLNESNSVSNSVKNQTLTVDVNSRISATGNSFFIYNQVGGSVSYSTDLGNSWNILDVSKFISDGRDANLAQASDGQVYRISVVDSQISETLTNLPATGIVKAVACGKNKCFAALSQPNASVSAIYVSTDEGVNWSKTNSLPSAAYSTLFGIENIFYAKTDQGVFTTSDDGDTWTKDSLPTFDQVSANSRYVIALYENYLFYKAYDVTKSVSVNVLSSIPTSSIKRFSLPSSVNGLAFRSNSIYAGTSENGVMESTDGGTVWQEKNLGINFGLGKRVSALGIAGETIYCGTPSSSSYDRTKNILTVTGGVFALSPENNSWAFIDGCTGRFCGRSYYLIDQYKGQPFIVSTDGSFSGIGAGPPTSNYQITSVVEHNGNFYNSITQQIYYGTGPVPGDPVAILLKRYPTLEGLNYPITNGTIYNLASFKEYMYATDGEISFTPDGNYKTRLILSGVTDRSAKAMISVGNRLIVSCSKGLLISSDPQKEWRLMPLDLEGETIKKLYADGNLLYCLTDTGLVFQISGIL